MKISDRDKKLIMGVILLAIILLPIFLFIKPKREEMASLESQLDELNERYEYLKGLWNKKDAYEKEIERLVADRNALLDGYAEGILQENTIMFLVDCEDRFDMRMGVLTWAEEEVTHVCDGSVNEDGTEVPGLDAIKSTVVVTYDCEYEDMKKFLDYIFQNPNRMLISNVTMDVQPNNKLQGTFMFDQFAITGDGRSIESTNAIPYFNHGVDRPFVFHETEIIEDEEPAAE